MIILELRVGIICLDIRSYIIKYILYKISLYLVYKFGNWEIHSNIGIETVVIRIPNVNIVSELDRKSKWQMQVYIIIQSKCSLSTRKILYFVHCAVINGNRQYLSL